MLVSAYTGIEALERADAERARLEQERRISTQLTDEVQGEEAGLSSIFYGLARSRKPEERRALLEKLETIEGQVEKTLYVALRGRDREPWLRVQTAARDFSREVRRALTDPRPRAEPSLQLYQHHEELLSALAGLVATNYRNAVGPESTAGRDGHEQLRRVLALLGLAVVVSVICAVVTIRFAAQVFRRIRWQSRELSRLSNHAFETQEVVVRRISRELHDEFGQTLSAIEANLASIGTRAPELAPRIEDCLLLVKDAMASVREMSQLLRPSILDDFGLVAGLQWLADTFTQRTGVEVKVRIGYHHRLPDETETHLFRIVQEALTNVARHSGATMVELVVQQGAKALVLTVADNGHGFGPKGGTGGFGLMGMRERVRSIGGELEVRNSSQGVTISVEVPIEPVTEQEKDQGVISG
jgi:signal transduction histidine kinase